MSAHIQSQPKAISARAIARDILVRVGSEAAYAERALHTALQRSALLPRDKALTTELVYGTLRHEASLDASLRQFAPKLDNLPVPVLAALRLGAYQILHTRVPTHSAVNESVALVARYGRLRGLVNAVLRRISELPREDVPLPEDACALATATSHPQWLVEALLLERGLEATHALLSANNETPPVSLRVNTTRAARADVEAALREKDIEVCVPAHACAQLEDSLHIRRAGAVTALPGFAEGHFTIQDMAATLVGHLAAPKAGQFVLDVCAAPGGKTTHLAELMGDEGCVLAIEKHPGKSRLITQNAARLGLSSVRVAIADATDAEALHTLLEAHGRQEVDVAVLDAPCAGMGTLRRNPELRQRTAANMDALTALQAALLDTVSETVRVGGALVYAVCSLTEAEGPRQIEAFLQRHPHFKCAPPPASLTAFSEGAYLRTWTHLHGTDCFFAARLERHSA